MSVKTKKEMAFYEGGLVCEAIGLVSVELVEQYKTFSEGDDELL